MIIKAHDFYEWWGGRSFKIVVGYTARILKFFPGGGPNHDNPSMIYLQEEFEDRTRTIEVAFLQGWFGDTHINSNAVIGAGGFEYYDSMQLAPQFEEQKETYRLEETTFFENGKADNVARIRERNIEMTHKHGPLRFIHVFIKELDNPEVDLRYGVLPYDGPGKAGKRAKRKITVPNR